MDDARASQLPRPLSRIALGTFKIGRTAGAKYPNTYDLPSEDAAAALLGAALDLGITLIDTAPAYGLAEERIGRALAHRRDDFILSTKVGEHFEEGASRFDFTARGIRESVEASLRTLRTEVIDILLVHSSGDDLAILAQSDTVETLHALRDEGKARLIGFSGKTVEGQRQALDWADALMVEYNLDNRDQEEVIATAADTGAIVLIKKGLASGHLDGEEALRFLMQESPVAEAIDSVVIGSGSIARMQQNYEIMASFSPQAG
ncbi:MAG: aldo/keto reductase [Phycisphaerales bacterium]|jgi:aryl-alcohol dehydrogenase-like predicted oxidoreductase|nr:aldo/keto reductase [Phycisphaerales bacterium]